MYVQEYLIHMNNGDTIVSTEPYEMDGEKALISMYENAKPEDMLCIGNSMTSYHYFRAKDIAYISTNGVKKISDEDSYIFKEVYGEWK